MAIPQNKTELINSIETEYQKLIKSLNDIIPEDAFEKSLEGHSKNTIMSIANLVSYLIGWNELVIKWLENDQKGIANIFPEIGFKWNELGRLAQKFYADYDGLGYAELLVRLGDVKAKIISEINIRDNSQLYETTWYEKWTMGRMIQFNTSSPYKNACARINKYKRIRKLKKINN